RDPARSGDDRPPAVHARRRRPDRLAARGDSARRAGPPHRGRDHGVRLRRSPDGNVDRAVRPLASSRGAGAGARPRADDARPGGAVMTARTRCPGRRRPLLVARRLSPVTAAASLIAGACSRPPQPDAYGNVEATDVAVSAEAAGRLVSFTVVDGQTLAAGASVGAIDATQVALERDQASAQRAATAARID